MCGIVCSLGYILYCPKLIKGLPVYSECKQVLNTWMGSMGYILVDRDMCNLLLRRTKPGHGRLEVWIYIGKEIVMLWLLIKSILDYHACLLIISSLTCPNEPPSSVQWMEVNGMDRVPINKCSPSLQQIVQVPHPKSTKSISNNIS